MISRSKADSGFYVALLVLEVVALMLIIMILSIICYNLLVNVQGAGL